MSAPPEIGSPAPDFTLPDQHGRPVRLADLHGRANVVLVFFPHVFTPLCDGELGALRDAEPDIVGDDVALLAVSCDPTEALRVFAEQHGIGYPLLSDFWPHGEVSRAYGAFFEPRGFPLRATFVIDRGGVVRWRVVNSPGDARDVGDYRAALDRLR